MGVGFLKYEKVVSDAARLSDRGVILGTLDQLEKQLRHGLYVRGLRQRTPIQLFTRDNLMWPPEFKVTAAVETEPLPPSVGWDANGAPTEEYPR